MKITKPDNVTKIESGNWKLFQNGDAAAIRHITTNETMLVERSDINDLVEGLKAVKHEMIREHHG